MSLDDHLQTAIRLLRTPRFDYREFPETAPIRRLLLVNGRWKPLGASAGVLTLEGIAKLYAQLSDGSLIEWQYTEEEPSDIEVDDLFEYALNVLTLANPGALGPRIGQGLLEVPAFGKACGQRSLPLAIPTSDPFYALMPLEEARHWLIFKVLCQLLNPTEFGDADSGKVYRVGDVVDAINGPNVCPKLDDALRAFRAGLESSAVELCLAANFPMASLYNYLTAGPGMTANYRCDAVRVFPALAKYLATSFDDEAIEIRVLIDRRQPLVDGIARVFGVTRDVVKTVAGRKPEELGFDIELAFGERGHPCWPGTNPEPLSVSHFFSALAAVPAHCRPQAPQDWRELHVVQGLIETSKGGWLQEEAITVKVLRFFAERGWTRATNMVRQKFGSLHAFCDCDDFLDTVQEVLWEQTRRGRMLRRHRRPGLLHRGPRAECSSAVVQFAAKLGVRRLLELSRKWHDRYVAALANQLGSQGKDGEELPALDFPLKSPVPVSGYVVVPLLCYADLVIEGVAMRNCVATRYQAAVSDGVRVFSIRSSSGERLSTFDLSFAAQGGEIAVRINEHRGSANADPPDPCRAVANEFVSRLNEDPYSSELRAFVDRDEERRQAQCDVPEDLDRKIEAESALKQEAVSQVMGPELRKLLQTLRGRNTRERLPE